LEGQARERYGRLDRLSSERDWCRDQYDALDALIEALRTDNGWLEYRLQVVRDAFLDQGTQAAEDASAVEKVTTTLLERDEALWKAREDLAVIRTVAVEWETEVASTRAQLQQDHATLEGARSWQSQAKEKAKEAEQLRVELVERATALSTAEGQLQQEQSARHQAKLGSSRSNPLSRSSELPPSVNAWCWRRHRANFSGSVLCSRRLLGGFGIRPFA
jgi:hypothetical protein